MKRVVLPTRASVAGLALLAPVTAGLLVMGAPLAVVVKGIGGLLLALLLLAGFDLWRSLRLWAAGGLRVERRLPAAFAIGVPTPLQLDLVNPGLLDWRVAVFDDLDPVFDFEGLPRSLRVAAQSRSRPRRVSAVW